MAKALYFDGLAARSKEVDVEIEESGIRINDPAGREIAAWPFSTLFRAMLDDRTHLPLQIGSSESNAVLLVEDADLANGLIAAAPQLGPVRRPTIRFMGRAIAFGLGSLVLLTLVFIGIPMAAGPIAKATPYAVDVRLGVPWRTIVRDYFHVCNAEKDQEGLAIVRRMTERMTPPNWPHPVEVHVVRMRESNAFAIPGGPIVLTTGFLRFIEHPDELAAVIAHEIGHLVGRHSLERALGAFGIGVFVTAATSGNSGPVGMLGQDASQLTLLAYSRDQEREADAIAIERLMQEGISPLGIALYFERITGTGPSQDSTDTVEDEANPGPRLNPLRQTHPDPIERAQRARQAAQEMGPTKDSLSAEDFAKVRAMCPIPRWTL